MLTPMDFDKNLKLLKTHKNSYMGPLCITDPEYGPHGQGIKSFDNILPQIAYFRSNTGLTPMDFERKFDFL
jgi:hypothetical protein